MAGDVTIGALQRVSYMPGLPNKDGGQLIAGQDYFNVYFTGGLISGVTITNANITLDSINNTPIGNVTPSTGVFTTLKANSITIGTPAFVGTGVAEQLTGSVAGYWQEILQNTSAATNASSDYIACNNLSTDTTFYGDFGINSSTFTGTGSFNLANATYLYGASGDLVLGTVTANGIHLVVNNGSVDALNISSAGAIKIPAFGTAGAVVNDATGLLSTAALTGTLGSIVASISPTLTGTLTAAIANFSGAVTITGQNASIFAVGRAGATNPALVVDSSVALSANGVQIQVGTGGSGVNINTISSSANEALNISSKGTGILTLNSTPTANGTAIQLQAAATNRYVLTANQHIFTVGTLNTAATIRFSYVSASDGNLTLGTEAPNVLFDLSANRNHAMATLALQRDFRIAGTDHSFTGASTLTNLAVLALVLSNGTSANATVTNYSGLLIQTVVLAGTKQNAFGINVAAPSGATVANWAAQFLGNVTMGAVGTASAINMNGSTSGSCTVAVAAAAGTATRFQLPATNGTSGFFLQTDGAGNTSWQAASLPTQANNTIVANISGSTAAPTAQNAATVGASEVLLGTVTASNSASVTFSSIPSGYDQYELRFTGAIPVTNSVALQVQVGNPTIITANYSWTYYEVNDSAASGPHGSTVDTAWTLITNLSNTATIGASGRLILAGLSSTNQTMTTGHHIYFSGGSTLSVNCGGRQTGTGGPFTVVKVLMSSGNINNGVFSLYGIRNA